MSTPNISASEEHDAAVDDQHVVVKLVRHHIHAEFAQASERNDSQFMV